jgi:hypothetical protein
MEVDLQEGEEEDKDHFVCSRRGHDGRMLLVEKIQVWLAGNEALWWKIVCSWVVCPLIEGVKDLREVLVVLGAVGIRTAWQISRQMWHVPCYLCS